MESLAGTVKATGAQTQGPSTPPRRLMGLGWVQKCQWVPSGPRQSWGFPPASFGDPSPPALSCWGRQKAGPQNGKPSQRPQGP